MLPTSSTCPLFMFQVQDAFFLEAFPDRLPSPHLSPRWGCVLLLRVPAAPCTPSHSDCLTPCACSDMFPMDQEVCVGRPCLLFSALFHQHFAQRLAHSRYLTSEYIPSALLYAFQGKRIFLLLLFSRRPSNTCGSDNRRPRSHALLFSRFPFLKMG